MPIQVGVLIASFWGVEDPKPTACVRTGMKKRVIVLYFGPLP